MTADRSRLTERAILALLILASTPATAGPGAGSQHDEAELARCIRHASAGKPWLERTLWGLRDQEAGWIGAEVANRNGTHDMGPLQVNSFWVPKLASTLGRAPAQIRQWLIHDACFNVQAARWIFLTGLASTRNYWTAIGSYHSPTEARRRRYSLAVAGHLRRRFGPEIFSSQPQTPVVPAQEGER